MSRSADDRVRRAESLAQEATADLAKERDNALALEKEKLGLERTIKELNSRVLDLEATALSRDAGSSRRLEARVEELSTQLDNETKEKLEIQKNARKTDRVIRELQFQLGERDKQKQRYEEETDKWEQKLKRMKSQLEELETSESNLQLSKRRAEREANEYRDRALRFEKENEKLKMRIDRAASAF
ncbi:myosin tail [Fimicolochytrium jonesii]|uniref:myosin tail n=1 Tax=Fimicolochytrium jonesii TaxID=1396493 RepID=UPI0022FE5981|nr:myosin tail [Fimicolochytrium jonesii]KAI8820371.1 myosin tail [Fimicolochytrium jonesii]